jgi:hypothetical protein
MVTAMRVAGNEEGDGDGDGNNVGNGDGDGNEGGKHATAMRAMAMATARMWAMATAPRETGNIEGNGQGRQGQWQCDKGGGIVRG